MGWIRLPRTEGCLVCGRGNPHGLHLIQRVEEGDGVVRVEFVPGGQHIGFDGIVHGGILATVLDEAMVWAATWRGRRFCVCGGMTVRFRRSAGVGEKLLVEARVASFRSRLIETAGEIRAEDGSVVATATGKYVPVSAEKNRELMGTMVEEEGTAEAAGVLKNSEVRTQNAE